MAKTYIDTVKYLVHANVEIGGLVEKPDVVGALFGQTEGLLGDELDLRELQKNGRIGRIEVDLQVRGGKSVGKVTLPSSLDMVETSILAAALETVDRVGPCEAHVQVEKIEDTRSAKRKQVVDRAKGLLRIMLTSVIPESRELSEMVRDEVKVAEISEWGPEKLPSGPNIDTYGGVVLVEGRADVLNLLKNDVNNCVAVGGANVPRTIVDLCRAKEVTVFLDGDRGGDIILNQLSQACEIDFVCRAPRGKEVEELTRKEIIKCMRARVPADQVEGVKREGGEQRERRDEQRERRDEPRYEREPKFERRTSFVPRAPVAVPTVTREAHAAAPTVEVPSAVRPTVMEGVPEPLKKSLDELENTLRARLYDSVNGLIQEVPVRDLIKALTDGQGVHAVVLDGIVTQRLVDLANEKGVKMLLGVKLGNLFKRPEGMVISTKAG